MLGFRSGFRVRVSGFGVQGVGFKGCPPYCCNAVLTGGMSTVQSYFQNWRSGKLLC